MRTRIELHNELLTFFPNAYFRPPANLQMVYPCIVYNRSDNFKEFANNGHYRKLREYSLMVIERDATSTITDDIEEHFDYARIENYYTTDGLHHTTIKLYY